MEMHCGHELNYRFFLVCNEERREICFVSFAGIATLYPKNISKMRLQSVIGAEARGKGGLYFWFMAIIHMHSAGYAAQDLLDDPNGGAHSISNPKVALAKRPEFVEPINHGLNLSNRNSASVVPVIRKAHNQDNTISSPRFHRFPDLS
jgi:hypothetical protein